jgi:hypothetical protein
MSIHRKYEWKFRGKSFWYAVDWPEDWLSRLESESHEIVQAKDYDFYVNNDPYESELEDFIGQLIALGGEHLDLTAEKEALEYFLAFVQSLSYYSDRGEYPRYPMETLIDKGGDCEDTAILMACIAQSLGYDCAFLRFHSEGFLGIGAFGHVDLGIAPKEDGEFSGSYWCDDSGRKYYFTSCNGKDGPSGNIRGNGETELMSIRFREQMDLWRGYK